MQASELSDEIKRAIQKSATALSNKYPAPLETIITGKPRRSNPKLGSGIAKLSPGAKRSRKALLDKKFRIG